MQISREKVSLSLDEHSGSAAEKNLVVFNNSEPIQTYELATVTRRLLQHVEDEASPFPKASMAVKQNVYVDDLIERVDSTEKAIAA